MNSLSLNALRKIATFLFMALLAYLAFLLFYPFQTIEPRVQPYRILTPQVMIGDAIIYEANYCKYTTAPALVTRNLMSDKSTIIGLPTTATNLPKGCHIAQSATTVVPAATPPGRYKIVLTITYRVNALREITNHLETDYFTVIPKE